MTYDVEVHEVEVTTPKQLAARELPKPHKVQGFTVQAPTLDLARAEVRSTLLARGYKRIRSLNLTGTQESHRFYTVVEVKK